MEPAHPKRQHLTPQELQQRLSQLVGRPLGNQEMNQLIPNFPDLLDGGDASFGQSFIISVCCGWRAPPVFRGSFQRVQQLKANVSGRENAWSGIMMWRTICDA